MYEFDIYLPSQGGDRVHVSREMIEQVKADLREQFGGYTHFTSRNEGAWKSGSVTFYDEVTILRVLSESDSLEEMRELKERLQRLLEQEQILVIGRTVEVI